MSNKNLFNDRLKYIGCTKKELSEKSGVHSTTIRQYACCCASVSPIVQEKIEKAMDELYKEKLKVR